jgi:hypothetical protein
MEIGNTIVINCIFTKKGDRDEKTFIFCAADPWCRIFCRL